MSEQHITNTNGGDRYEIEPRPMPKRWRLAHTFLQRDLETGQEWLQGSRGKWP